MYQLSKIDDFCRSREGAWIEIILSAVTAPAAICRSREGAWIEIPTYTDVTKEYVSLPRGSVD